MGASGRSVSGGLEAAAKRDSAKMNRVVNSIFRNVPVGPVRIENELEQGECCAFPARAREIQSCGIKFLLSSTEV